MLELLFQRLALLISLVPIFSGISSFMIANIRQKSIAYLNKIILSAVQQVKLYFYILKFMPIRQGGARLWFNTKEEQDEFDDKMIASVVIQSSEYEDPNFTPIFFRKREESLLRFTDVAKKELRAFETAKKNYSSNLFGKRDHTYWRDILYFKYSMSYLIGYLLLRELPIRNLYARAWIMAVGLSYMYDTAPGWIGKGTKLVNDPFLHKDIKNYGIYNDLMNPSFPTHHNKLPEYRLWKLNQPGHLVLPDERYPTTAMTALKNTWAPTKNLVPWDGTFNMPLDGLANPKHKDAKWIDFQYV